MTPWNDADILREQFSNAQINQVLTRSNHSTYPLVDGENRCVGVVSAMDVLVAPEKSPRELARAAIELPVTTHVSEALRILRERGGTLLIARDGEKEVGVCSLRDMLESVVGAFVAG